MYIWYEPFGMRNTYRCKTLSGTNLSLNAVGPAVAVVTLRPTGRHDTVSARLVLHPRGTARRSDKLRDMGIHRLNMSSGDKGFPPSINLS